VTHIILFRFVSRFVSIVTCLETVATTNAIAAGLQILQLFRILQCQIEKSAKTGYLADYCSYVNIIRQPTRNGLLLTAPKLEPPNPHCYVCKQASMSLTLNTAQWTLGDLLNRVIKKDMGFEEPSLMLGNDFIWEEGEDADTTTFAKNLSKRLTDLPGGGITHGTVLQIEDFSQDLNVSVTFTHQTVWEGDDELTHEDFKFVLSGNAGGKPSKVGEGTNGGSAAKTGDDGDNDDDDDAIVVMSNRKRPTPDANGEPVSKKRKMAVTDAITIDDD